MRTQTTKAPEVIALDRDSSKSWRTPGDTGLAFIDDAALLSERVSVSEALQHEPADKAKLTKIYDALTTELDHRASRAWAKDYQPHQELERVDRAPADMSTWELIATYRYAWTLAYYRPRGYLAKALANWLFATRRELESRGAWIAEIMPPHSM